MIDAQRLLADLQTHHIEGIAREGNTPFTMARMASHTRRECVIMWGGQMTTYFAFLIGLLAGYFWARRPHDDVGDWVPATEADIAELKARLDAYDSRDPRTGV